MGADLAELVNRERRRLLPVGLRLATAGHVVQQQNSLLNLMHAIGMAAIFSYVLERNLGEENPDKNVCFFPRSAIPLDCQPGASDVCH